MQDREDCAGICQILAAQLQEALTRFNRVNEDLAATFSKLEAQVTAGDGQGLAAAVQGTMDDILFVQAQEQDIIRQMMEAVIQALSLLPDGIDVARLAQLYVSEAQRSVHEAALAAMPGRGDAG